MKKLMFLILSIIIFHSNLSADVMAELAKRDRNNPISLSEYSSYWLYTKDGYLHIEYWEDGCDEPSIVAYQIKEDSIKLIIRIKTWDFAYRFFDYLYERDGIDQFTVTVHDYCLAEIVYVNGKLETYCNRIKDINANGFIYNDARISSNIKEVPSYYYPTYPGFDKEGMKVKISSLINERTNDLKENSFKFATYDYYYNIIIDGKQERINGYLLDFDSKIDYRIK